MTRTRRRGALRIFISEEAEKRLIHSVHGKEFTTELLQKFIRPEVVGITIDTDINKNCLFVSIYSKKRVMDEYFYLSTEFDDKPIQVFLDTWIEGNTQ